MPNDIGTDNEASREHASGGHNVFLEGVLGQGDSAMNTK